MLSPLFLLGVLAQPVPQTQCTVPLEPKVPGQSSSLFWSPKGAKVALEREGQRLSGQFELGPAGSPPVRVELARLEGSTYFDVLRIDLDRDGQFGGEEIRV
ncbi:MAG: hypothetical protein R3F33_07710 [Planctomycetota bacterium]